VIKLVSELDIDFNEFENLKLVKEDEKKIKKKLKKFTIDKEDSSESAI